MKPDIVVADYGSGNLQSILSALKKCSCRAELTAEPEAIASASHLIIPGVGAFGECMNRFRRRGLVEPVLAAISRGAWILGICVGMQILFEKSDEFGSHQGLGILPGAIQKIPTQAPDSRPLKVPNIGWLQLKQAEQSWDKTILQNVPSDNHCYFVHSFMAQPDNPKNILALANYGGLEIVTTVNHDNIYGTQFHPEKSGTVGLDIFNQFITL